MPPIYPNSVSRIQTVKEERRVKWNFREEMSC